MDKHAPPEVLAIGEINFTGNLTPHTWYEHLRYDSGKPNLSAITILGEIVYWYRPVEVRDETTGELLGYKKKFKGDKLQRSYASFANQFGLTKKQARDAISFLVSKDLVDKELRTIQTEGVTLSNVLFIGINPQRVKEINTPCDLQVTPMTSKSHPIDIEVTPSIPVSQTYTEITTETTTEDKESGAKINFDAPPHPRTELVGEIVFFQTGEALQKAIVTRVMSKTLNLTFTETGEKKKYVRPAGVIFYQNGGEELSPVEVGQADKAEPLSDGEKAIRDAIIDLMPEAGFVAEEPYRRARRMNEILASARKANAAGMKAEEFEEFGIWYRKVLWADRDSPPAISLETIRKNWENFKAYRGGQNGQKANYRGSNRTNGQAKENGGSQLWPMPEERVVPSQLIKRIPVAEPAASGGD